MFQGGLLSLHIGPAVTAPAPAPLLEHLQQATVTLSDSGQSGFQLTFRVGRDRITGLRGFPPLMKHWLRIGHRVQITGTINGTHHSLMDGIITNHQLAPTAEGTTLTVTGQDITILLDLIEVPLQLPAMPASARVLLFMAPLAAFGVAPLVIPSPADIPPLPTDSPPSLRGTFMSGIKAVASAWSYVFAWMPGLTRGQSFAYYGPKAYIGRPQRALTFGMGGDDNVNSMSFSDDGNKPNFVYGVVQDRYTNAPIPVVNLPSPLPPLAALPAAVGNLPFVRTKLLPVDDGGDAIKAYAMATVQHIGSVQGASTAQGELDTTTYGGVLKAHELVEVRGVGWTHDGPWYINSVTHTIARGSWTQGFQLERSGTGALTERIILP